MKQKGQYYCTGSSREIWRFYVYTSSGYRQVSLPDPLEKAVFVAGRGGHIVVRRKGSYIF
jgi:hypothetical protein